MNTRTLVKGQRVQVKEDCIPFPPRISVVGTPVAFRLLRGMRAEVKAVSVDRVEVRLDSFQLASSPSTAMLYPRESSPVTISVMAHFFWSYFEEPTLAGVTAFLNR